MIGKYDGNRKRKAEDPEHHSPEERAWRETRALHPVDDHIRELGWQIESRPKTGEPTWRRHGVVKKQTEVLCGSPENAIIS